MPSIASVYVDILPSTAKVADGIARALKDADKDVIQAARRWKRDIEKELKDVDVKVDANTAPAKKQIRDVEKGRYRAEVKVEANRASLAKVSRDIQTLTAGPARIAPAAVLAPTAIAGLGKITAVAADLTGVLGLIPAAAGAAGLAFGSLKIATSGFGDAMKAIGDPTKFAEAVGQLAPNAAAAARSIQGLMPQVNQLKFTLQDALFAGMGEQIAKLGNTYLPVFQTVMSQMAGSANRALTGISEMFQTPEMQADVKAFGANAASAFDTLSQAAQPFARALADIATVGSDFLPELAGTVRDLAEEFSAYIGRIRETGELKERIQDGIDAFVQLKNIALDVWNTVAGVFRAAGSDGENFLTTVERLTDRMVHFVNSAEGQEKIGAIFTVAAEAAGRFLPMLARIAELIADHPRLIDLAVGAWVLFKGAKVLGAIGEVAGALSGIGTTLGLLPGKAAAAGGGIGTGITGGLSKAGFLLRAGIWTLPVAIAYTIIKGDTTNQPSEPGVPDLFDTNRFSPDLNAPPKPANPGSYGPNATSQEPFRLPNQAEVNGQKWPAKDTTPGQVFDHKVPGAIPTKDNRWMIPWLVSDPNSTGGRYIDHPPSTDTGSREPDQGPIAANPPAPPVPDTSTFTPPPPVAKSSATHSALQESGLQQPALETGRLIEQLFPQIKTIGGVRADSLPYHPEGRALDVMIPDYQTPEGKALGDSIKAWALQNAEALGLEDVIWQDFWQPASGAQGHALGRSGDTQGHRDHVHLTFKKGATADVSDATTPTEDYVTPAQSQYDYNGPGTSVDNPTYVSSVDKDTGGKQLGKDIISGFGEILGFGDIFKSPTDFEAFKLFKGLMGIPDKMLGDATFAGTDTKVLGGGSFWGNLVQSFLKPYGDVEGKSPANAPEEFIPGLSTGGGGGLVDFATSLVPGQGKGGNGNDNSFNVNIAASNANAKDFGPMIDDYYAGHARQGLRNQPG